MGQDSLSPLTVTGNRESNSSSEIDIQEIQAERVSELLGYVPGLGIAASDSAGFGDTLSIRGSANTLFFGGAGVALVVDDVPFGDVFTYSTEFFDLDSFTVHRGPQGSRFGRNGAGGLIELHTAGPTETPEYRFSAEYGSFDLFHLRFRASGPISDKWAYTFQSYYKERNGFIKNINPAVGGYNDTREQFGALGNLYYKPSSDLTVRFRALYEQTRDGSQRLTAVQNPNPVFGPIDGFRATNRFRSQSDLEGRTEIDRFQLSLHFEQDLNWATLKSITSYQRWDLGPSTADLDLTPFPASTSDIEQSQDLWSHEFRLESDQNQSKRWTLGLAYLWKDNQGDATRFFGTGATTFSNQTTSFLIEEESIALFSNLQWDLNDKLTIEYGNRLEYVNAELERAKLDFGNTPGFPAIVPTATSRSEGVYFSPSLGVSYHLNDQTTLFARTSVAFKPQGFTAFSDNPATNSFDEERSWETEIGVRYHNLDNTFGVELRGYYKQIDDYQVNRSIPLTDFIIVNADRVEAFGLEGELSWHPTNEFTVEATAGWNQVEFTDHQNGAIDLSDNEVPFIPQFNASLILRYDFPNGFFAQTGVRAVGKTYFDEANTNTFRQSSYEVWDAQIGYQAESWDLTFFARNLFDREFDTFLNNQISAGTPGDPQILGMRVGLKF